MERQELAKGAALIAAALLLACGQPRPGELAQARASSPRGVPARATGDRTATLPTASAVPARAAGAISSASPGGFVATGTDAGGAPACPPLTPAAITAGHQLFNGAGNCSACHGRNGVGAALGPTMHPHKWLTISGSYSSIADRIEAGVPNPTAPYTAPMPPKGGANLSTTQVCQIAAYVYSLSHPAGAMGATPSGAPAVAMTGTTETWTVGSGTSQMRITFTGTPDRYTIRVTSPSGQSNSFSSSGAAAPTVATAEETANAAMNVQPAPPEAARHPAAAHATAPGCPSITPALVSEGKSVFTGPGNCSSCHGANAGGTGMAPTLHAHSWLDISGSYPSIVSVVTRGVAHPKEHPAPMPPMGGAQLSRRQICAVSAYVYSLSH